MPEVFDLEKFKKEVEEEVGYLLAKGVPPGKAEAWARVNVLQGVSNRPRAAVQYAAKTDPEVVGAAIQKFYDECRAIAGRPIFVGD